MAVLPATIGINKIEMKNEISGPFSAPWKNSDAVLIVEGHKLHVHTTILSMASPVFETMFNSGFKESITKEVELKDKKYDLVEILLKMIYPNQKFALMSIQTMQGVLELSKEYMIDSNEELIEKEAYSLSKTLLINGENNGAMKALDLLKLAESGEFQETVNNCCEFIAKKNQYSHSYSTLHGVSNKTIQTLCKEKGFSRDTETTLMCHILHVEFKRLYKGWKNDDHMAPKDWNDINIISGLLVKK